jgi:hypothetical protein
VTFWRPIGAFNPDGSFVVRNWSVTLPSVEIGPAGRSTLHVNTGAIQQEVQAATKAGESIDSAIQAANLHIDANGDGLSDVLSGTPFDGRAPVSVTLLPPAVVEAGRDVILAANLSIADGTAPNTTATVKLSVGDASCNAAIESNGSVACTISLPAEATLGWAEFTAAFTGDAIYGAASSSRLVEVTYPLPTVRFAVHPPFDVLRPVNGTISLTLDVGSASNILPDGAIRIDDGDWIPAHDLVASIDVGPTGLNLTDGFHTARARVTDIRGAVAEEDLPFVLDTHAPKIASDRFSAGVEFADGFSVRFAADEPVIAMLNVTDLAGAPVTSVNVTHFAKNGTLTVGDLPPGAYLWSLDVLDTAGNTPLVAENVRGAVLLMPNGFSLSSRSTT